MPDASKEVFGILTSRMHMAWLAHIGGRLKSDFQYSGGVVFNTFPYPEMSGSARQLISSLADTVLAARNAFPEASLSDLYDPVLMPPPLRKAHHALDVTVDKLYQPQVFATDTERVEHLFGLYEKMIDPLTHQTATARKRRARTPVV